MKITAKAGAKINLTLDIVGVREDGYHLVDMIMQSVSLYDTVTVERIEDGVNVTSTDSTLGGEDDICHKAAKLFFAKSGTKGGANIEITKNIPLAAGLGGGSADAAAVIMLLNKLYGNPLSLAQLKDIALKLGADVPFFLHGGTISVTGIGEIFEKLPNMPDCFIVIAKDAEKRSTKEMYRVIDSTVILDRPDNSAAKEAILGGNLNKLCKNVKNVFSAAWQPNAITDILKQNDALAVSLSGSGPSYFGIFDCADKANGALSALKKRSICSFIAKPTDSAIVFE